MTDYKRDEGPEFPNLCSPKDFTINQLGRKKEAGDHKHDKYGEGMTFV